MIVRLAGEADMAAVLALRHEVFVLGQGVPVELEHDERDAECDHAVALVDGVVVGTGRLLPEGVVGRMAVAESARGLGVGAAVLELLEQRARERAMPSIELHAQLHAVGFYDKAGYTPYGAVYLEAGIEHQSMRKSLAGESSMSTSVVHAFLAAAAKRDYAAALPLVADDIEYQNMMLPAVHGKDAMVETLEMLLSMCSDSEWVVLKEVAAGDLVMNERVDRFTMNGVTTELPVAGVFTLRDGLIAVWHDYFDLQTIMAAMGAAGTLPAE